MYAYNIAYYAWSNGQASGRRGFTRGNLVYIDVFLDQLVGILTIVGVSTIKMITKNANRSNDEIYFNRKNKWDEFSV